MRQVQVIDPNLQKALHTMASQASYGVPFMNILDEINVV